MVHPVIKFFIWLKWCLIRKYVSRTLQFRFFLLICLSWYLVSKYEKKMFPIGYASIANVSQMCDTNFALDIDGSNSCLRDPGLWCIIFCAQFIAQICLVWMYYFEPICFRKLWATNELSFAKSERCVSKYALFYNVLTDAIHIGLQTLV